jgi:hypothetical protein
MSYEQPSDLPAMPAHEEQSAQRGHPRNRVLVAIGITAVVVAALVVGLLARAGVLAFNRTVSTAEVPTNWQTFHDPFGLYTLRLPPGWTGYGGIATKTMRIDGITIPTSSASETKTVELFTFANESQGTGSAQVFIESDPIRNTVFDHQAYCPDSLERNATFHGLPALHVLVSPPSPDAHEGWDFATGNAYFFIEVSPQTVPHGLLVPTATPFPAAQLAIDQTDANRILASFQPSDIKPLAC